MPEQENKKIRKIINDLGIASFAKMHGFYVCGRRGKSIYFEINASDEKEFDNLCFEYLSSPFYTFDSNLMILKKMSDFVTDEKKD